MEREAAILRLANLHSLAQMAQNRFRATAGALESAVQVDPGPYGREADNLKGEYNRLVGTYLERGVLRTEDLVRAGLPVEF